MQVQHPQVTTIPPNRTLEKDQNHVLANSLSLRYLFSMYFLFTFCFISK